MRRPVRVESTSFPNSNGRTWIIKSGYHQHYHRRCGPAIELASGSKQWCLNGSRKFWQSNNGFYISGGGWSTEKWRGICLFPGYEPETNEPATDGRSP